jgi:hypothetical protein
MSTTIIGDFFPAHWIYGEYEQSLFADVVQQVKEKFANTNNVVLNLTWDGPQTTQAIQNIDHQVDNLFVVSTVDSVSTLWKTYVNSINATKVYHLGNFDSEYQYNFFAIVCADLFKEYRTEDLILTDIKYRWISYNRKPYDHRRQFVEALQNHDLLHTGIVTMGRNFPGDPRPDLYCSIGERDEDYVKYGHWYELGTEATPHQIPHDLFSLHNWHYWQHHFLHIVGCTFPYNEDHLFTNQIDFKPIIGLRPFIINGQTRKYQWWRNQGFRTFESWFPTKLDRQRTLTDNLVATVKYVNSMSIDQLQSMYNDMLPDLLHNRARWYEWAAEQKQKVKSLFNE